MSDEPREPLNYQTPERGFGWGRYDWLFLVGMVLYGAAVFAVLVASLLSSDD